MKFYSKFHPKEGKRIRLFGAVACRIMGLFRQPFENIRCIYFVAAHKLILNVSKIRLRLICACASYLHRLFSKAYGESVFKRLTESRFSKTLEAGPPRHHYAKANTQRIIFNKDVGVSSQ